MPSANSVALKKIKLEIVLYAVSKAVPGLISMLTVIAFARLLGLEIFGKYALLSSIVFAASTLGVAWWNQAVLRFESNAQGVGRHYLSISSGLRKLVLLCIATFAASIACLSLLFLNSSGELEFAVFVSVGGAAGIYTMLEAEKAHQQACFRPVAIIGIDVIRTGGLLMLGAFGIWYINADHVYAIFCIAISSLAAIIYSRKLECHGKKNANDMSRETHTRNGLSAYFRYGWPLGLWVAAMSAMQVVDRAMLGNILGDDAVGLYGALYELIVKGYSVVVYPVTMALHPHIMSLANNGRKSEIRHLLVKGLVLQGLVIVVLSIVLFIVGEPIIKNLIGIDHPNIMPTMLVLLLGSGLWQMALLVHKPMEYENKTLIMLLAMVLALFVNVICNLTFIPLWGIVGAAWAVVFSASAYLIFTFSRLPVISVR